MQRPDQVAAYLRNRFDRDYPDWARGRGTWPMKIPLGPPGTAERSADPVGCHDWAALWDDYSGPGKVARATVRFPTGTHEMPKTLIIRQPHEAALIHPSTRQTWQRCGARLTQLQRAFPAARFDRIIRRITEMKDAEFHRLANTAEWLRSNPTSGLMLRQLPIEGVDTKWLTRNSALILALLGDSEPSPDNTDDVPASIRIRLHERLGLRVPPDLVQVAVLDPDLRSMFGGMRHFAASVDDLNRWERQPRHVIILENKETGYAITTDHKDAVAFHGQGFSVVNYARISWIRGAQTVIYWGDLDAPGLEFVNDLRGLAVTVRTILTDLTTLERYRHLAVDGALPDRRGLPYLTAAEEQLHAHLVQHAAEHGTGLSLEQERIPWAHAHQELLKAIGSPDPKPRT